MGSSTEWLSPSEVAALVRRNARTVRRWVSAGDVSSRIGVTGALEVNVSEALQHEPTVRRGRPSGTARPNIRHAGMSDLH
jgi:hypothetical protein